MNYLDELNAAQKAAVTFGEKAKDGFESGPLLVLAGAGSGKTKVLAHRVVHLIINEVPSDRILLLTFTNQAAKEMKARVQGLLSRIMPSKSVTLPWAGTFHAVARRFVSRYASTLGIPSNFSIYDTDDSISLMDLVMRDRGLTHKDNPDFPEKGMCLSIYSWWVNSRTDFKTALQLQFPKAAKHEKALTRLFKDYTKAKLKMGAVDFDDLLLFWNHLLSDVDVGEAIRSQFDHVLVDEYQDTNPIQAEILLRLKGDGRGLTVVGDDAQAIYSFRAATVANMLRFPKQFEPTANLIKLEQNYRSTQPILEAANAVMALAGTGFSKKLFSDKPSKTKPDLITVADELDQARYICKRLLRTKDDGVPFADNAVLFRSSSDSNALEVELSRRGIPFRKFGGQKFLDAAHIKDCLSILRWVGNPADRVSGFRCLQLVPGVGRNRAGKMLGKLDGRIKFGSYEPAGVNQKAWMTFVSLIRHVSSSKTLWPQQMSLIAQWYTALLPKEEEDRAADVLALCDIAASYKASDTFLADLLLDPLASSTKSASDDEDCLTLSTIHSAKGKEWSRVFVLNVINGRIPFTPAKSSNARLEEERRLLYVAMTRAKKRLALMVPTTLIRGSGTNDARQLGCRSSFIPDSVQALFRNRSSSRGRKQHRAGPSETNRRKVARAMEILWGSSMAPS